MPTQKFDIPVCRPQQKGKNLNQMLISVLKWLSWSVTNVWQLQEYLVRKSCKTKARYLTKAYYFY